MVGGEDEEAVWELKGGDVTLKSIDEHNAERRTQWEERRGPFLTGIKCPNCGGELQRDPFPPVLVGYPPHVNVNCPECDWRGSILA